MTEGIWLSLDELIAQREARRAQEEEARQRKQPAAKEYAAAFDAYQLTAEDKDTIMRRIAKAFADGRKELMLFALPSELCPDGGRHINDGLEGWEATLPGAAQRDHEFWRDALQPPGFRFLARVISYPDGMPGDAGVFFSGPKELEE